VLKYIKVLDISSIENALPFCCSMVFTTDRRASQRCSAPGGRNATAVFAPLLVDRTSVTDTQTNGVTRLSAGTEHLRAGGNAGLQPAMNVYRHCEGDAPCMEVNGNLHILAAIPKGKNSQDSKRGRLITFQETYETGGISTALPQGKNSQESYRGLRHKKYRDLVVNINRGKIKRIY
jgi:hypothetical protein